MKTLVLNSGSSSLKCQYFVDRESVASVIIERIGEEKGHAEIAFEDQKIAYDNTIPDHHHAIDLLFEMLKEHQILTHINELNAVGHRVVHGGDHFQNAAPITSEVIEKIEALIPLAPLHNPANLNGIKVMHEAYPDLFQVAVFDTAFHQTIPEYAYRYAIPYDLANEQHIKRYGFHGTSHLFVSKEAAKFLKKPIEELKILTLHLGNGGSITAVDGGKSINTSMGFTPLEGLIMGTRSGDLDAAIIPFLMHNTKMSIEDIDTMLNKESGLKGICGTNDMRELFGLYEKGDPRATLALKMYVYRIVQYIGSYGILLGKIDAIVFTGGIGEHSAEIRAMVCNGIQAFTGAVMDHEKNNLLTSKDRIIHKEESKMALLVIPTNEELEIALQTEAVY